jgi:hypothetical protein
MSAQPSVGSWLFLQFLDPIHSLQDFFDGESARRKSSAYSQIITIQTIIPQVLLEPATSVFDRVKTVHASDRAALKIGRSTIHCETIGEIYLLYFEALIC